MKNIYFILFLFGMTGSVVSQQWEIVTVENGIKPSIALADDNTVYIAYMNEKITGFIKVAELENDVFDIATVDNGYFYGPLDIVIDNNGHPRVGYHDHNIEEAVLMIRNASGWFQEVIPSPNHDGWDTSLAIDSNNGSHVASVDPVIGLEYARQVGGNWVVESPGTGGFMYRHSTSIALDSNDDPHISYYKDNSNRLELAKKVGNSWEIGLVDIGGRFPSMVLDAQNTAIVAYYDRISGPIGAVKVATLNNGSWDTQVIDTLDNVELTFGGARNVVSLQIGPENNLHLSYGDKYKVCYAKRMEGVWKKQLVVDVEGLGINLGQQTSLGIDDLGFAHITYFEKVSNADGGIIKYANNQNFSMLVISCPSESTYVCDLPTDLIVTGFPEVLNNPGEDATFNFEDALTPSGCGNEPDVVVREWTVSNEFGNFDQCFQLFYIDHYGRDETEFPSDFSFDEECFYYPEVSQTGEPSNLCLNILSRFEDELLESNCETDATIRRRWFIEDWCQIKLDSFDQMLHFNNYTALNISTIVIIPDTGMETGSISFNTNCGIPDYQYSWSNGTSTANQTNLSEGVYSVTISDGIGCTLIQEFDVPGAGPLPMISGFVRDQNGQQIADITPSVSFLNGMNYNFEFCPSVLGESYAVCFEDPQTITGEIEICIDKEDVAASGTSGLDVVKAQRIILGLVDPCPFNVIASDVNQDGKVSGSDLVIMSRVILGLSSDFTNNVSWRFIKEGTVFLPDVNPLDVLLINECALVTEEEFPLNDLDFVGIKLGNLECVDGDLFSPDQDEIIIRSEQSATLSIELSNHLDTQQVTPIFLNNIDKVSVAQIALDLNSLSEYSPEFYLNPDYNQQDVIFYHHHENGILKVLLVSPMGISIDESTPLFYMNIPGLHSVPSLKNIKLWSAETWNHELADPLNRSYDLQLEILEKTTESMTQSILIAPNPFTETTQLEITHQGNTEIANILVYNLNGEIVLHSSILLEEGSQNIPLDPSWFEAVGTYIVQLITDHKIYTAKAVKIR